MKRIDVEQGSLEWLEARMGICTASELDALVTPEWAPRKPNGKGVKTYLSRKLAEKWRGCPLPTGGSRAMEAGTFLEPEAIPYYEMERNVTIERLGFVLRDDGSMGCSPDGMLPDPARNGLEVKCPLPQTHVGYLLDGELPDDYAAQVQGSIYVCGADHWAFMSYCRGFPALLIDVPADPCAQRAIADAVGAFNERLVEGWVRLVELYGGEPKRQTKSVKERIQETWDASLVNV